jgi:hypothetical protein
MDEKTVALFIKKKNLKIPLGSLDHYERVMFLGQSLKYVLIVLGRLPEMNLVS